MNKKESVVRARIDRETIDKAMEVLSKNDLTISHVLRRSLMLVAEGDLSWLNTGKSTVANDSSREALESIAESANKSRHQSTKKVDLSVLDGLLL